MVLFVQVPRFLVIAYRFTTHTDQVQSRCHPYRRVCLTAAVLLTSFYLSAGMMDEIIFRHAMLAVPTALYR